jgi:multiple sugar transport system permease protein
MSGTAEGASALLGDLQDIVRGDLNEISENTVGLLLTFPLALLLVGLYLIPILQAIGYSLQEISLFATGGRFIGAEHYLELLRSSRLFNALRNGLVYTGGTVALTLVVGVGTGLLLNRSFVGERLVTGLILSPYMIPVVGIVIIYRWFFNGLTGVANYVFVQLGLIQSPVAWFSNPDLAMPLLIVISGWALYPFVTMLVLAKLQTIPAEYYEAAELMGASTVRQFVSITLPQLRGVLYVAILLRMLWTFNLFDIIWLGTQGGPGTATETLPVMAYRITFDGLHLGEGAAVAVLTFAVLAVLMTVYTTVVSREAH